MVRDEPVIPIDSSLSQPEPQPYLIASLARTACFGNCPAFQTWIYSDGTVLWCGEEHVDRMGEYKAIAPHEWLAELQQTIEASGIWKMAEQYPSNGVLLPDVPLTVLYYNTEKKERRIVDNADAPLNLLRLEQYFEAKMETLNWEPFQP
ncbi:MAG: hypothetical protein IPL65_22010 [Lewinellaceae bacterium]|nr:hypothetical protein [Lewinellaceae bacterium]